MNKIIEKLKKKWYMLIFVIFIAYTPAKDVFKYLTQDSAKEFISYIVMESAKESIEQSAVRYSVTILSLEMKNYREPEQVDLRVQFWKDNNWNAQLAALKLVSCSQVGKRQLKRCLYDERIFRTLMEHAK